MKVETTEVTIDEFLDNEGVKVNIKRIPRNSLDIDGVTVGYIFSSKLTNKIINILNNYFNRKNSAIKGEVKMKLLKPSDIRHLNNINGNGFFFSRKTMKFFGDTMRDFGTYLEGGRIVLYHKKRDSKWIFDPETSNLRPYRPSEEK